MENEEDSKTHSAPQHSADDGAIKAGPAARMQPQKRRSGVALKAAIVMFLLEAIRSAWFVCLPVGRMVQRIPDDAFYYLMLGKNFAVHHAWTFDGTAPSSGFHLLWGYTLAALAMISHTLSFKTIFLICAFLMTCVLAASTYWITSSVDALYGPPAAWGGCLVLFSAIVQMQATWLMEAPLLLFFAAACLAQITLGSDNPSTRSRRLAFTLGLMGTLSRSDFGMLTLILLAATMVAKRFGMPREKVRLALLQFLGAAAGLIVVSMHTFLVSGHFLQASAEVKLWWGELAGHSADTAQSTLLYLLDPLYNLNTALERGSLAGAGMKVGQILFLLCSIGCVLVWRRAPRNFAVVLLPAMAILLMFYVCFYAYDGAMQDWYAIQYVLPMCVLAGAAASTLRDRWIWLIRAGVVIFAVAALPLSLRAYVPWQESTYRAGELLRSRPDWRPIGSWNAGVISYFGGGRVVNLDGLVNDDLLPYIKSGSLRSYLAQRRITHIVETPEIWNELASRSGLGDGSVARCIDQKIRLFPDDPNDIAGNQQGLTYFHLDERCLNQQP